MTDGIIQKVFNKHIILREVESGRTQKRLRQIQQELIEEVKICMVSLYEQNPLFHANALKVIQRELIGDNE
jgi:hypothetical protein